MPGRSDLSHREPSRLLRCLRPILIARDAASGKLDSLADEALREARA
jgi:hypothetical protein